MHPTAQSSIVYAGRDLEAHIANIFSCQSHHRNLGETFKAISLCTRVVNVGGHN